MGVASLDLDRPGWRFLMASRNTNPGQMSNPVHFMLPHVLALGANMYLLSTVLFCIELS